MFKVMCVEDYGCFVAHLQGLAHYLPLDESGLQSSENESLEVHLPPLASNNTNLGNEVPEAPEVPEVLEWLDEDDDEDNNPAAAEDATSIEDLEDDSIQLVDSIQG